MLSTSMEQWSVFETVGYADSSLRGDLISVCKYLKCWRQLDEAKCFSDQPGVLVKSPMEIVKTCMHTCVSYCREPALVKELESMISKGPFQSLQFSEVKPSSFQTLFFPSPINLWYKMNNFYLKPTDFLRI